MKLGPTFKKMEDVSWAMKKVLNKELKNNARFLVFVADAPNTGLNIIIWIIVIIILILMVFKSR